MSAFPNFRSTKTPKATASMAYRYKEKKEEETSRIHHVQLPDDIDL
jgi:hypothetical protein